MEDQDAYRLISALIGERNGSARIESCLLKQVVKRMEKSTEKKLTRHKRAISLRLRVPKYRRVMPFVGPAEDAISACVAFGIRRMKRDLNEAT